MYKMYNLKILYTYIYVSFLYLIEIKPDQTHR